MSDLLHHLGWFGCLCLSSRSRSKRSSTVRRREGRDGTGFSAVGWLKRNVVVFTIFPKLCFSSNFEKKWMSFMNRQILFARFIGSISSTEIANTLLIYSSALFDLRNGGMLTVTPVHCPSTLAQTAMSHVNTTCNLSIFFRITRFIQYTPCITAVHVIFIGMWRANCAGLGYSMSISAIKGTDTDLHLIGKLVRIDLCPYESSRWGVFEWSLQEGRSDRTSTIIDYLGN